MNVIINNYDLYKGDEIIIKVAKFQVEKFPFLKATTYISNKASEKGYIFISDKSKDNVIKVTGMEKDDIKLLKTQKEFKIGLVELDGDISRVYITKVKRIK